MSTVDKNHYESLARMYDAIEEMPQSASYQEIAASALGDCTGKTVLDLGDGTGLHARKAADLGATLVDNVDISYAMLEIGKAVGLRLGRENNIRWHEGDLTKPLDDPTLEKEYDITMVNWTFDHAETINELETMWQNASTYTKKGGKLISIRMANPRVAYGPNGKYGVSFSEIEEIAGGVKYVYTVHTEPPMSCPGTTLSESMDFEKSKLMARRFGFAEFKKAVDEEMEVVKRDWEFWRMHVEDPVWVCVTATKVE